MTLDEYVAWNRRYLEEAGILPKGKEDDDSLFVSRLLVAQSRNLAQPRRAPN